MAEKRCAFCQRPPNEVKNLIGGPDGPWICDGCTKSAFETLIDAEKKAKPKKDAEKPVPKPRAINAYLEEYVIAQTKAKQDVSVAVYDHYKRREAALKGLTFDCEIKKSNMLILGPSGSGKTEIARSLATLLGVPFHDADASKLTQAGYVGDDVESLIQGLLLAADGDVEKAEWGIIFLDEVDKIARKSGRNASGYRDIGGEGVQQALLKMLEGGKMRIPKGMSRMMGTEQSSYETVDTTNILFICAGSFAGIDEIVSRRVNKGVHVGFGSKAKQDLNLKDIYLQIEEEDILEFGLIPEFLGRIPVHTTALPLTEDDMLRILTEPKNALVKQFKALFSMDGIDLQFDEAALRAVARKAQKRPTGARALRSILKKVLRPYQYDYPSEESIVAVRITEAVVEGTGEAILVNGTRKPQVPVEAPKAMAIA